MLTRLPVDLRVEISGSCSFRRVCVNAQQEGAGTLHATGSSTGPVEAPGEPLNLYRFPVLYDTLKAPDADDIAAVRALIRRHVGEAPWSIFDPAAGPGNWLKPFTGESSRLAGNDNCPEMVAYARANTRAEIVEGDMYAPPITGRFDVVLEASGVTSLVPDVATLQQWVRTLAGLLTPRGAVILLLNFEMPTPRRLPATLWRSGWRKVPGGSARIHYELLADDTASAVQQIRRTVETRGETDAPACIVEEYPLKVWRRGTLDEMHDIPGIELVSCSDPAHLNGAFVHPAGERLLVFKAR
jgi:hypothetical protein